MRGNKLSSSVFGGYFLQVQLWYLFGVPGKSVKKDSVLFPSHESMKRFFLKECYQKSNLSNLPSTRLVQRLFTTVQQV